MRNPNPNTDGLKPFKKGQSGNPGGMSSKTARLIRENAEAAARVRASLLKATEDALAKQGDDRIDAMKLIDAAVLKLIKDSEDRGFGAPVQQIDNTSSDGSMKPSAILIRAADDDRNN